MSRKKDDEQDSLFSLLVKAFINGFMLKLFEKLGEEVGKWLSYRMISSKDPSYYSNEENNE